MPTPIERLKYRLLYPIRERLTCSEREAIALIIIFVSVLTAGVMRIVRAANPPFDDSSYVTLDSLFIALSARMDSSLQTDDVRPPDTIHVGYGAVFDHIPTRFEGLEEWVLVDTLEKPTASFPIAINEANALTLQALPRIGPAMARRILEFRDRHGRLTGAEDLLAIRGIGEKTLQQLLPLIVFEQARDSTVQQPGNQPEKSERTDGHN